MSEFEQRFKIRPPFSNMSENDKKMIHESALEVMEKTGVPMSAGPWSG